MNLIRVPFAALTILCLAPSIVPANICETVSQGTYNMAPFETLSIAESRAVFEAKQVAIQKCETFLESYPSNLDLAIEDKKVLFAASMDITVLEKKQTPIADQTSLRVKIKAKASKETFSPLALDVNHKLMLLVYSQLQEDFAKSNKDIAKLKANWEETNLDQERNRLKELISQNERNFQSNQLVERGCKLILERDYGTSIQVLKTAIKLDQENVNPYLPLSCLFWFQKQTPEAIYYLNTLISLKPRSLQAFLLRGMIHHDLHKYNNAIDDFNRALGIDENSPEAYLGRGEAYEAKGGHGVDLAIADYSKAISIDPTFERALKKRHFLYSNEGKAELALRDCETLLKLKPENPFYFLLRGRHFETRKMYNKALEDYRKAIDLDPSFAAAYIRRGYIYLKVEQYKTALDDFTKVVKMGTGPHKTSNNDLQSAYFGLGATFEKMGNVSASIANYREAATRGNKDAQNMLSKVSGQERDWYNKGVNHLRQREYDQAIESFTIAIAIAPKHKYAYGNRGIAYTHKNMFEMGIADFSKVIELSSNDWTAYNRRGFIYYKQGNYEKAINDFNRAIELSPNNFASYSNRGWIYLELEKGELAKADFEHSIRLNSNKRFADPYIGLAVLSFRQGRREEAKDYFQKATEIDESCSKGAEALEEEGYYYTTDQRRTIHEIIKNMSDNSRKKILVRGNDNLHKRKPGGVFESGADTNQSLFYTRNPEIQKAAKKLEYIVKGTITVVTNNSVGSGFIINSSGFAVTNYHVLRNEDFWAWTSNGKQISGRMVRSAPDKDLALIKLSGEGYAYLPLSTLDNISLGKDVYAIGTPSPQSSHGRVVPLSNSISKGIVSSIRKLGGISLIQTDAPINPGNSGGPLVSPEGLVFGIVTAKFAQSQGLGFAISSDDIISSLNLVLGAD